ncbi:MAG: threonine--tRNA ligase [Lachnospiraceae bacterium]|nr:threonine--tRNA ligase [Lachnospiraceae bacterium]
MKITLVDGSVREYSEKKMAFDIAMDISEGLGRAACAAEIDGKVCDLRTIIDKDCTLRIFTAKDPEGLRVLRHTASHVLAEAVKVVRPNVKVAIGPAIDTGFYYDFDTEPFSREDLDEIEKEMKKIIKKGERLTYFELPREEAIKKMEDLKEPYKVELIRDLPEDAIISFYSQGEGFTDLCAGPHLMNTRGVKAFKLISSSMAYWRGDEKRERLQRIYGTAFDNKEELDAYLEQLEDAKRRDHNKLGREMGLFTTVDCIGQGLPLFTHKGTKMIMKLQRWVEDIEEKEWGYVRTRTPLMAKSDLYKISGHWDHYLDGMFVLGDPEDKECMALRPMTCPFQYFVYKNEQRSYRDLPYRMGETSTLFRNEDSGEMHGLTRVRQFTISEGHNIIRPDQTEQELKNCIDLAYHILSTLGLQDDVTYRLSKWDPNNKEKYLGDDDYWNKAQDALREVLIEKGVPFTEADGEAAFYGPKIDIQAKNVYGKEDTMITVQLDCAIAEKFDMYYIDQNGDKVRPYIIHRTSLGCYERTLAWLIEHYAGNFPTWLCPEQVRILPISDKYIDYANKVCEYLKKNDVDATVDARSEKIGFKIREARLDRIPYRLVVGEQEEAAEEVAVGSRFAGDEGKMSIKEFTDRICEEIRTKTIREVTVKPDEKQGN